MEGEWTDHPQDHNRYIYTINGRVVGGYVDNGYEVRPWIVGRGRLQSVKTPAEARVFVETFCAEFPDLELPEPPHEYALPSLELHIRVNPEGVTHGDAEAVMRIQRQIAEERAGHERKLFELRLKYDADRSRLEDDYRRRMFSLEEDMRAVLPKPSQTDP